ncbi:MAG: hypothetical protein M0P26_07905, partial [Bacteroidales bacterium]|nr:hypothetical protein [Bacteroidales bacterium]
PTMDLLCEKYYSISPYAYCANNPVRLIDPDGRAWKATSSGEKDGEKDEDDDDHSTPNGYEWVSEDKSYNKDGNLLTGLYHQAIFFSDNGTFDPDSKFNMGSSTATVYMSNGTTTTFDACTNPSDADKYATIPEGLYEANVGIHNGSKSSYTALKMKDVGAQSNTIELGELNPSAPSRTYAEGIDLHKSGVNNKTGMTKSGYPISSGCGLIDINDWSRFIGIFNNSSQKNNPVSVIVSRTYSSPLNHN